jgi:hypothetical protein
MHRCPIAIFLCCIPYAHADIACNAVIRAGGDLYMASADKDAKPIMITDDRRPKSSVALAPASDRVSFVYGDESDQVQIVDLNRHQTAIALAKDPVNPNGTPLGTRWDSADSIAVEMHGGPASNRYQWISSTGKSNEPPGFAFGFGCTRSAGRRRACAEGYAITFDDGRMLYVDPFEKATSLGSFTMSAGETLPLPGYDGASMTLVGVSAEGSDFRAGLRDRQPESVLSEGEHLIAQVAETVWGDFRILSQSEKKAPQQSLVDVRVLATDAAPAVTSRALAWSLDGQTLATIKEDNSAALRLVTQDASGNWSVVRSFDLGADSVEQMKYVGPTLLFVQSAKGGSVYSITDDGLRLVKSLPRTLPNPAAEDGRETRVLDWSCVSSS